MMKHRSIYFFLVIHICCIQAMEKKNSFSLYTDPRNRSNNGIQYYISSKAINATTRNNLKELINKVIEIAEFKPTILEELERPHKTIDLPWNENIEDNDIKIPLNDEKFKELIQCPVQKEQNFISKNNILLKCYQQLQRNTHWHYDGVTMLYVHKYLLKCMQDETFKHFIENPSDHMTSMQSIIQTYSNTLGTNIKWPTISQIHAIAYYHTLLKKNAEFDPKKIRPFLGALATIELLHQSAKDINLKQKLNQLHDNKENLRIRLKKADDDLKVALALER